MKFKSIKSWSQNISVDKFDAVSEVLPILLNSGLKRRLLIRGEGGLLKIIMLIFIYYFEEIHNSVPNLAITPITKTEHEIGFVSPFY